MARRSSISMVMGKIFGSENETGPSAEDGEISKKLKATIYRGTSDNDLSHGGADSNAADEVMQILKENSKLTGEVVALIKARVKDDSPATSRLGIDFLDQCMQNAGFEFRELVLIKIVPRIIKLAEPNKGIHPSVQRKAFEAIKVWAKSYGSISRLGDYAAAGAQVAKWEPLMKPVTPGGRRKSVVAGDVPPSPGGGGGRRKSVVAEMPPSPAAGGRGRRGSAAGVDLSILSEEQVTKLAQISQQQIAAQMRETKDQNELRELQKLYDQLSLDLGGVRS